MFATDSKFQPRPHLSTEFDGALHQAADALDVDRDERVILEDAGTHVIDEKVSGVVP